MVSRGIRGQSVAGSRTCDVLFGGFDDGFWSVDGSTGRVGRVPASGRTLLYPWDEQRFLVLEEALGRLSRSVLSLRELGEPGDVVASVAAIDMPCDVGAEWGSDEVLIPGHFPVVFQVGGGSVGMFQPEPLAAQDGLTAFVPGIYSHGVPAVVDGRLEAFYGPAAASVGPGIPAAAAVGCGDSLWLVGDSGLTILAGESQEYVGPPDPERWRPQAVEHHPHLDRVVVASWNRWGSLGGPSSDIFVFTGGGELLLQGHVPVLVERMAMSGERLAVVSVEENVHSCDLVAP